MKISKLIDILLRHSRFPGRLVVVPDGKDVVEWLQENEPQRPMFKPVFMPYPISEYENGRGRTFALCKAPLPDSDKDVFLEIKTGEENRLFVYSVDDYTPEQQKKKKPSFWDSLFNYQLS